MTAPTFRILIAVIVVVGLFGGVAIATADAGDDDRTLFDRMHDGVADHVPGDHHADHASHHADHHDGDHASHHADHHDGDHAAHHGDGGHCD